jgi:hypothetical protein
MKKSLIVLLSVMVVLAFAASAFALHQVTSAEYTPGLVKAGKSQIELGGEIRIRGNLSKNSDFSEDYNKDGAGDYIDKENDTVQAYDQRVRLRTKANVTDKTMGLVELETGTTGSTYTWGGASNAKSQQLSIRQAYISHQFGMIGGIKAGHMLLGLGNRLFFDHTNYGDDALLGWVAVGPGEISLIDIKVSENGAVDAHNKAQVADDYDAYVLAVEMPINAVNVSADVTYLRNRDTTPFDKGLKFFNVGARADADLKVVKVKADVEVQSGKSTKSATEPTTFKYKGYAAMVGVEANAGPVTIRGGAAYGSGNKEKRADQVDKKDEGFQTLLTDTQYSTFIYDYSVIGASGATNQGLENTMYVTVGASVKPIPDLKVSADAYLLRAAQKVAINDARKDDSIACTDIDSCDRSKKLGYEVDAKIEYQLASNLAYFIEAGYLFAGDAYDVFNASKNKTESADNPYRVRHGLLLTF